MCKTTTVFLKHNFAAKITCHCTRRHC